MSISERFPETVLRLACVASSKFRLDFEVILPVVFQKSGANTLVIFALMRNFCGKGYPSLDSNAEAPSFMSEIQNSSVFPKSPSLTPHNPFVST